MSGGSLFDDSMRMRDPAQQKRKKARAPVNRGGEFAVGAGSYQECTVNDIGTGGLSFATRSALYPGDSIRIRVKLGEKFMDLPAMVARSSGKTVAAVFDELSEDQVITIQEYIHQSFFERDRKPD